MSAHAENPPETEAPVPAALGYHMPAEWEPHEATWLSWPRPDGISFPDSYERITPTLAAMVHALSGSEKVNINVCDADHEALVREHLAKARAKADHVTFYHIPTNEPWCRDHGPIYLTRAEDPRLAIVDWDYNAWGWKYPPFDFDDDVPKRIAEHQNLPIYFPKMVLEGGSIDVNGAGTLLTTRSCLLNPNRNPDFTQKDIEQRLRDYLGIKHILWLGYGIEGDDTYGHVYDLTRFVSRTSVVTVIVED
jgi:agmatine deiminase